MTPWALEFTSVGPDGTVLCGAGGGAVRGLVWLVVAPHADAAMALIRIMFRINDMAESSVFVQSNAGAGRRFMDGA
jgi:hypothetical protein